MFEPDFLSMFAHTVQIQRWDGTYDGEGNPSPSATVLEFQCRISGKKLGERRSQGDGDNQDVFDIWFYDPENRTFTVNDKVTLPTDLAFAQDRNPSIYAVARVTDEEGQHHIKIQCGWQYHRQGQ